MLLTYRVPEWARDRIQRGLRVVVPFRRTYSVGVVVDFPHKTDVKKLRSIAAIPDKTPLFSEKLLELLTWLASYYGASPGDVYKMALPGGLGMDVLRVIKLTSTDSSRADLPPKSKNILEMLVSMGPTEDKVLKKKVGKSRFYSALEELFARELVEMQLEIRKTSKPKSIRKVECLLSAKQIESTKSEVPNNASRQIKLLEILLENPDRIHLYSDLGKKIGYSTLRTAIDNEWISSWEEVVFREPTPIGNLPANFIPEKLTKSQDKAFKKISASILKKEFHTYLLWGVTGSGKTEVYINCAKVARKKGLGVLVLVPEIALTPQLWSRFEQRFPNQVAILHSALKQGERFDAWRRLASGDLNIAVGPRSAIFAPVQNLGLIIVDEEHETSYKQNEPPPYYNARDVAIMRASTEKCPVVLGSATPCGESFHNAAIGKYSLLKLPERVPGAKLPQIIIVDMAEEREKRKNFSAFSGLLTEKLVSTLKRGHRAMLLLNRRGFSSYLQCPDCGYIPTCKSCSVGLTYHRFDKKLRCHYCGMEQTPPDRCPECGSDKFAYKGRGTQRIVEELQEIIPETKIFRLDTDAARSKGHGKILESFLDVPASVLVGTQMIAKGHDFPDVTLVGVLNADIGLTVPDFRSGERIFQLLTQVSGRAGRGQEPGEVVIQTYRPDSPAIEYSVNGDVESFFELELKQREELDYPPFGRIIRVVVSGDEFDKVRTSIFRLTRELNRIDKNNDKYILLGPATCPLSRLKGKYRWHFLLKTQKTKYTLTVVKRVLKNWDSTLKFKVIVDPITLF